MRTFAAIYDGFVIACAITLLCVRSITVCMHVNIGALFTGALIASSVLAWLLYGKTQRKTTVTASVMLLAACTAIVLALYIWVFPQNLTAQPVMAMRLALGLDFTPPRFLGLVVPLALVSGMIALLRFSNRDS